MHAMQSHLALNVQISPMGQQLGGNQIFFPKEYKKVTRNNTALNSTEQH